MGEHVLDEWQVPSRVHSARIGPRCRQPVQFKCHKIDQHNAEHEVGDRCESQAARQDQLQPARRAPPAHQRANGHANRKGEHGCHCQQAQRPRQCIADHGPRFGWKVRQRIPEIEPEHVAPIAKILYVNRGIQPETGLPTLDQLVRVLNVSRINRQAAYHLAHRITRRQTRDHKDQRRPQPNGQDIHQKTLQYVLPGQPAHRQKLKGQWPAVLLTTDH